MVARLRILCFFCLACALSACGSGSGLAPDEGTPAAQNSVPALSPPAAPAAEVPALSVAPAIAACPQARIRDGTESIRVFETGSAQASQDLRWQASVRQLVRECSPLGAELGLKVGVSGRLTLGPKGQPGTYTLPVRIAVLRNQSDVLWSRVLTVSVTVAANEAAADFTQVVDDILVPHETGSLVIYAGFDPAPPPARPVEKKPSTPWKLRR